MFTPISICEEILFTTVRIVANITTDINSYGTGFLFNYQLGNNSYIFLVTNKHVIKDAQKGKLEFNKKNIDGKLILGEKCEILLNDFPNIWTGHRDENIDIAILPMGPIINDLASKNIFIYYKTITQNLIPTEDVINKTDAIEDVYFIGYPNNLFDRKNLIPIVRKGITATPVVIDFEDEPIFLIDASVFPGSSGSPVFIIRKGGLSDKFGSFKIGSGASEVIFLGILASGYFLPERGLVKVIDKPYVEMNQMIDIGIVFKSKLIVEMVETFLREKGLITD